MIAVSAIMDCLSLLSAHLCTVACYDGWDKRINMDCWELRSIRADFTNKVNVQINLPAFTAKIKRIISTKGKKMREKKVPVLS